MRVLRAILAVVMAASLVPSLAAASHGSGGSTTVAAAMSRVQFFESELAAQAHCPTDIVVWLNTKTGIWHEKGMRWYGRTRQGAYVCRKEAAAAGYRDTRNGQ
jgi:hypothetical protein